MLLIVFYHVKYKKILISIQDTFVVFLNFLCFTRKTKGKDKKLFSSISTKTPFLYSSSTYLFQSKCLSDWATSGFKWIHKNPIIVWAQTNNTATISSKKQKRTVTFVTNPKRIYREIEPDCWVYKFRDKAKRAVADKKRGPWYWIYHTLHLLKDINHFQPTLIKKPIFISVSADRFLNL